MDVTVLRPDGFGLPEQVMARARAAAEASGGALSETDDRQLAMKGAHVLYAKSWSSTTHYGTPEAEAQARSKLAGWTVDETWFDGATPDCVFMHCLPVRREVVVRSEVLDGPRSRVIRQAANRMYTQMAVLRKLMSNRET
jgi:N-acetylornithine carbamoyltransferase